MFKTIEQKPSALFLVSVFFFASCDFSTQEEIYNPDYTPEISVFSIISTDNSHEFVIVERTLRLNENDVIFSTITNSANTIIDDANVYLISDTDTVQFRFSKKPNSNIWDTDYLTKGMYLDLTNEFCAEPGKTYRLVVHLPDGRTVTGSTTVPELPEISDPTPESVFRAEVIKNASIHWQTHPKTIAYEVQFFVENRATETQLNFLPDNILYESPTTLSDLDDYHLVNDVLPLSNIATIKMIAFDQNSYDYTRLGGLAALIGTDLNLLQGGVGAFGSFSVDSVNVFWE